MFADRLKNLREQKGLTQQQMLDEIIEALSKEAQDEKDVKLSLSTYRNWEQGVSVPNSKYLRVIAPLLHTTTDYLLGVKHENADYLRSKLMLIYDQLNERGQEAIFEYAKLLKGVGMYDKGVVFISSPKLSDAECQQNQWAYEVYSMAMAAYDGEEFSENERAEAIQSMNEFQAKQEKNNK